jgi:hypothetical protein
MIIFLNCDDNDTTFNKKNYLLRAAENIGMDCMFRDIRRWDSNFPLQFVLNIVPYTTFRVGTQWTGVWEIDQITGRVETGKDWMVCESILLPAIPSSLPDKLKGYCGERTRLLFQACDSHLHEKHRDLGEGYDCVQCGSGGEGVYAERSRLLQLLMDRYTFHDFGKGYKPEEYVKNLSKAKVQFIRSGKSDFADGELAQRFFECMAIGPVLTNWVEDLKYTGFVEDEDYMAYRNDEELIKKMDLLLRDEDLRHKIAESGRLKALMYHSYENRLGAILNIALHDRK